MSKGILIVLLLTLTSCGSQQWRHGNYTDDRSVMKKREKQRDAYVERANRIRKNTAKHYIGEWKSHDGDVNLFRRDGFDWGF